jgi:hypothetical protein
VAADNDPQNNQISRRLLIRRGRLSKLHERPLARGALETSVRTGKSGPTG